MLLKQEQRVFISITISLAALTLMTVSAGKCDQVRVKHSPQDAQAMIDRIPGIKFKKAMPDNFPVPKYPSNVTSTNFNYSTKGLPAATANLLTSDSKQKVFDWYQQTLRAGGWDVKVPTDDTLGPSHDRISMLKGTRSKEEVTITCLTLKQKPGTSICIGWTKTP